jgi:oxalate---CoA ligase
MSNLTQGIEAWLEDKPAPSICQDGCWHTNEDVARDVMEIRRLLTACNIQPGDRVILGYPNSYAFVVAYFALLHHGAIVAPVNPGMATAELYAFLERSQAVAAFVPESQWLAIEKADELTDACSLNLRQVFVVDRIDECFPARGFEHRNQRWNERNLVLPDDVMDSPEPSEDDVGILLYTSGTTGRPKAVGLKHRHLYRTAQNVVSSHRLTEQDVTYCFLPLFHINAQVVAVLSTCLSGGRIVIGQKFSAKRFWPAVIEHGVTWVSAVPTVIAILLNTDGPVQVPPQLRFVRSASAQLPAKHEREFERRFGVPVLQSYGMTEAASQICVNPFSTGQKRIGSVGLPVGLDLQIVDDENGQLAPGKVGEIVIQGDSVIDEYVQADNQNDFQDGWFHTGDLGYRDADGYVFLVGRKKEMINRAGEKISPYEVEDVIREHPSVCKVAVIGVPDELYGERVAAYMITRAEADHHKQIVADILTLCRTKLSNFKIPSDIFVVSDIPVGPTGKIQRVRLKRQVLAMNQNASSVSSSSKLAFGRPVWPPQ